MEESAVVEESTAEELVIMEEPTAKVVLGFSYCRADRIRGLVTTSTWDEK